jgi:phosphoribosylformylglycinamidine (FGAM) synthase-like enzyme
LQIGDDCPDVQPGQLKAAWGAVQSLVDEGLVSAGHDISDGGIATTLLEMAFAGGSMYNDYVIFYDTITCSMVTEVATSVSVLLYLQ